jgi:hypothetical protein
MLQSLYSHEQQPMWNWDLKVGTGDVRTTPTTGLRHSSPASGP